jgi:DNA-binding NarL/FixJ family response regulator
MKVFLVEDSPLMLERLIEMLGVLPHVQVVGHTTTADAAIRDILSIKPDLVVLDLHLAEGSGFDVLRAVHHRAPGIEFYMLSNFLADPYRQLAERLGVRDFFDKSNELERMRNALACAVRSPAQQQRAAPCHHGERRDAPGTNPAALPRPAMPSCPIVSGGAA